MSTRVYLSKHTCQTTQQEDTPYSKYSSVVRPSTPSTSVFSTPISAMMCAWCGASLYCSICLWSRCRWRYCAKTLEYSACLCLYNWQKALLLSGMDSWAYSHGGGRRPESSTPRQQKRWAS